MDYNIQPSSPSSNASSTSSGSSPSRDASLRLPSDDELRREGIDIVIQRLRFAENEHKKLLVERSRSMKDVNRKLQVHLLEVRGVREVNQKLLQEKDHLLKEKEELAGICCFLDDDREKAKKVAREWQMFGRYATGVLQKELAACNSKIKELEQRQVSLLTENKTLKEICLMLDQEQAGSRNSVDSQGSLSCTTGGLLTVAGTRDSGDGSSNGSTTSNCSPDHRQTGAPVLKEVHFSPGPLQGEAYVRFLEQKVRHLEDDAKQRVKRITVPPNTSNAHASHPNHGFGSPGKLERKFFSSSVLPTSSQPNDSGYRMNPGVLELHDQLDDSSIPTDYPTSPDTTLLDDKEKAMVREMCNVVWRKLGDKTKIKGNSGKTGVPRTASVSNL